MWLGTTSTTMPRPRRAGGRARGARTPRRPPSSVGDPGVVDDVVAVRRPGRRLQDRRQVEVRDAERGKVIHLRRRVVEGEVRLELEPVGRRRARLRPGRHGGGSLRRRPDDAAPETRPRAGCAGRRSSAACDLDLPLGLELGWRRRSCGAVSSSGTQRSPYSSSGSVKVERLVVRVEHDEEGVVERSAGRACPARGSPSR